MSVFKKRIKRVRCLNWRLLGRVAYYLNYRQHVRRNTSQCVFKLLNPDMPNNLLRSTP